MAEGVLPPGEVQYPLAAITSIISWQVMAVPASASTFAAASRALSFFRCRRRSRTSWPFGVALVLSRSGSGPPP